MSQQIVTGDDLDLTDDERRYVLNGASGQSELRDEDLDRLDALRHRKAVQTGRGLGGGEQWMGTGLVGWWSNVWPSTPLWSALAFTLLALGIPCVFLVAWFAL